MTRDWDSLGQGLGSLNKTGAEMQKAVLEVQACVPWLPLIPDTGALTRRQMPQ